MELLNFDQTNGVKVVDLKPEEAFSLLARTNYEHNRFADKSHIDDLADMMTSGCWMGRTTLTFVANGDGQLHLVDGQHRIRAYQEACLRGRTEPLPVILQRIDDASPNEAYALLDTAQKKRSPAVIAEALELPIRHPKLLKNALSAGKWARLYTGLTEDRVVRIFDVAKGEEAEPEETLLKSRVSFRAETREYVLDRIGEFGAFSDLLDETHRRDAKIVSVVLGARVVPVVIETLASNRERATWLWGQVLTGSDGSVLPSVLRERLLERVPVGTHRGVSEKARFAAIAWNSFVSEGEGSEPRLVRQQSPADVKLTGASYREKPVRVIA